MTKWMDDAPTFNRMVANWRDRQEIRMYLAEELGMTPTVARQRTAAAMQHGEDNLMIRFLLFKDLVWAAMNYGSWQAYYEAEFGCGRSEASRVVQAGRMLDSIRSSRFRERLPAWNEAQLVELARLRDNHDGLMAALTLLTQWVEAGNRFTAAHVRAAVRHVLGEPEPKHEKPSPSSEVRDEIMRFTWRLEATKLDRATPEAARDLLPAMEALGEAVARKIEDLRERAAAGSGEVTDSAPTPAPAQTAAT